MAQQMELPLGVPAARNEDPMHQAWVRSGLKLPFELALQNRAIAICLRHAAETARGRQRGNRRG